MLGDVAQALQKAVLREHDPHVRRNRLYDNGRHIFRVRLKLCTHTVQVVVVGHQRLGCIACGHASAVRDAQGGSAGACLHKQAIRVPVVASNELQHL